MHTVNKRLIGERKLEYMRLLPAAGLVTFLLSWQQTARAQNNVFPDSQYPGLHISLPAILTPPTQQEGNKKGKEEEKEEGKTLLSPFRFAAPFGNVDNTFDTPQRETEADVEKLLLLDDEEVVSVVAVRAQAAPLSDVPDTSITTDSTLAAPPRRFGPITVTNAHDYNFDLNAGVLQASGGVQLIYTDPRDASKTTLNADSAEYNLHTGLLTAHKGARMDRSEGSFVAEEITYNLISRAGFVTNAIAETDYFRMRGERIEALADGSYVVENGVYTTCIRGRPDYQIRAKRLTIRPNQYVTARGITFYAGPTKLITLPSFRRNLNTKSGFATPIPGYNKSEGVFFRLQDSPILEPSRSLEFDGHFNFKRLPTGFAAYEFDLTRPAPKAPPPRSLRQALSDPLHGYLEQLTPPTYREYAEDRYEDEFAPRTTFGVVLQNDQYVYNRRRTDLRVSRFPELNARFINILGRARDAEDLRVRSQKADGTPTGPAGATINPLLQRTSSAPFLLDVDFSAGAVDEYPTHVTSGRFAITTNLATQPLLLGRRISLRFAATNWLNLYTRGTAYAMIAPEAEIDFLPTSTTRFGIGYRYTMDAGRTPFAFDHRDVRQELRLLAQTGGPYAFGFETKYDLERSGAYDSEFVALRNFDCMQVGVAYRLHTQSFSLIFNLLPPVRNRAARRATPLQSVPGSKPGG